MLTYGAYLVLFLKPGATTSPEEMAMAQGLSTPGLFALSPNWPVVGLLGVGDRDDGF